MSARIRIIVLSFRKVLLLFSSAKYMTPKLTPGAQGSTLFVCGLYFKGPLCF